MIEPKEVQNFEVNRIIETPDGNVEVYFSTSRRIMIDRRISTSIYLILKRKELNQDLQILHMLCMSQ